MFKVEVWGLYNEWETVFMTKSQGEAERYVRGVASDWRIVRWLGGMSWSVVLESY